MPFHSQASTQVPNPYHTSVACNRVTVRCVLNQLISILMWSEYVYFKHGQRIFNPNNESANYNRKDESSCGRRELLQFLLAIHNLLEHGTVHEAAALFTTPPNPVWNCTDWDCFVIS